MSFNEVYSPESEFLLERIEHGDTVWEGVPEDDVARNGYQESRQVDSIQSIVLHFLKVVVILLLV